MAVGILEKEHIHIDNFLPDRVEVKIVPLAGRVAFSEHIVGSFLLDKVDWVAFLTEVLVCNLFLGMAVLEEGNYLLRKIVPVVFVFRESDFQVFESFDILEG